PAGQRAGLRPGRQHRGVVAAEAGGPGTAAGARPGPWRARLRGRPGVRALLLAGPPRRRPAKLRPGPAVRARGRAPARRPGLAGQPRGWRRRSGAVAAAGLSHFTPASNWPHRPATCRTDDAPPSTAEHSDAIPETVVAFPRRRRPGPAAADPAVHDPRPGP